MIIFKYKYNGEYLLRVILPAINYANNVEDLLLIRVIMEYLFDILYLIFFHGNKETKK